MKGKGLAPLAAYWFFLTRTESFIAVDESAAQKRFLALTDAIFQNFRFIVITLSKEDDPQVIFQTLNSGGEPLAAMDLVRNDVFLRAIRNGEDESQLMKKYWSVFFANTPTPVDFQVTKSSGTPSSTGGSTARCRFTVCECS